MSINWTNELELKFLEYFQAEPILWNSKLKDYKNKLKSHDAWCRVSALMGVPIEELKNKKNSLFASYRAYKNKVKKSENSGDDVYKPIWFAYELIDSFLGNTTKCNRTINTEEHSTTSGGNEDIQEEQSDQNPQGDDQSDTVNANARSEPTNRRRKQPNELFRAAKVMKEALFTFNATVEKNTPKPIPKEDDDCDLYAKLLATKLRKLPERQRLRFMHYIDGIYMQYAVPSESPSPVPSPSP